jgi:hypothetical protein
MRALKVRSGVRLSVVLLEVLRDEFAECRHLLATESGEVPAPKRGDLIEFPVQPFARGGLRFEAALAALVALVVAPAGLEVPRPALNDLPGLFSWH